MINLRCKSEKTSDHQNRRPAREVCGDTIQRNDNRRPAHRQQFQQPQFSQRRPLERNRNQPHRKLAQRTVLPIPLRRQIRIRRRHRFPAPATATRTSITRMLPIGSNRAACMPRQQHVEKQRLVNQQKPKNNARIPHAVARDSQSHPRRLSSRVITSRNNRPPIRQQVNRSKGEFQTGKPCTQNRLNASPAGNAKAANSNRHCHGMPCLQRSLLICGSYLLGWQDFHRHPPRFSVNRRPPFHPMADRMGQ